LSATVDPAVSNDDALAVPRLVAARRDLGRDLGPGRRREAGHVEAGRLDAAPMLAGVRADDLDLHGRDRRGGRNGAPGGARGGDRVDAVGDHGAAEPQIVGRDRLGDPVAGLIHRAAVRTGVAQRLLDRIDAQVHGADLASERPRERRLADARRAAEDDQHRGAPPCIAGSIAAQPPSHGAVAPARGTGPDSAGLSSGGS
jgi:hypothetical protein